MDRLFRSKLRSVSLAFLGAGMLVSAPAFATPETDAKDLFARGVELRKREDCGSAVPLFRKAWSIYPSGLGSLRNLAECEEMLGHYASSRRAWLDLKRALITAPPETKYEGWDKDAEDAAARLKPKVASFVVDVYVKSDTGEELASEKTGVEIFVNGESVGTQLVSTPVERDPGQYLIRAQLADAEPVEQTVQLSAGDNPKVTIRLARRPRPGMLDEHSTRRTVGWAVAGAGAAALVASGVTFLVRQGAASEVDDQCPTHTNCPSSLRDTVDKGTTMSTLTTILLPIGVVGLGAGIALVLVSRAPAEKTKAAAPGAATLRVAPTLGGVAFSGSF